MTRGAWAAAAFLIAGYVALALAYRSAIPLFEGPDEPSHLHYAVFVYEHGRLPREQPQEVPGEGMQPPLAYLAAAPLVAHTGLDPAQVARALHAVGAYVYGFDFSSPGSTALAFVPDGKRIFYSDGSLAALTALRGTSLAFGLCAVLLTFAAACRASGDPRLALLAGALLAFSPQFLFVSGYFSNDPAATAVGAAALFAVVDAIARGGPARGHYAACAVVIALGLLTKTNTVPGLAVAAVAIAWIDRRPARERARDASLAAGLVLALAGPYLVWSLAHGRGLLGLGAVSASASWLHVPAGQLREHLSWTYWSLTFQSYWCRFGWMTVGAPGFVVGAFAALCAAGVVGCFLDRASALRRYLLASIAATGAAHLALNLTVVSAQGRQLFPIAPQVALLLALGLARLFGERRRLAAVLVPVTALLALDVYCLLRVLAPAYGD
jgi:hypothetical protein